MELLNVYLPNWILWTLLVFITLYIYYTWHFNFFKSRGIPGPKPIPALGNMLPVIKSGAHRALLKQQEQFGKVHGYFEGRMPSLFVSDVEILKHVLVKDFSTFVNRRKVLLRGIFGKTLFDVEEKDWRRIRSLLTPTFTSGKMRQMDPVINATTDKLLVNIRKVIENGGHFEAKQYTGAYTMDIIAATAFGLELDSQRDKANPFVVNAQKFFDLSITSFLILILVFANFLCPLLDWCGVCMFSSDAISFFSKIIRKTVEQRKHSQAKRVDFLQLMLNAHNEMEDTEVTSELKQNGILEVTERKGLTTEEIVAQGLLFFVAGYDTTASTLGFFLYNMATNPDVQDKVVQEIQQITDKYGSPGHDTVGKMIYLDMCINETLRKFPPLPSIDRRASKDIVINGLLIPKDLVVVIPIYALHHDPETWPDPDKFDPERFSAEAKALRSPFHFLPFGQGPRQCAGMRLAQLEMKVALARLLLEFRFLPSENTQVPIKLKNSVLTVAEKGIHLIVQER